MKPTGIFWIAATLCLTGQAYAQPLDWVSLPGGCFEMGETTVYPEEAPAREACVEPFAITRTEISVAQFRAFVSDTGYRTRAELGGVITDVGNSAEPVPTGGAVFSPLKDSRPRDLNWWRWDVGAYWEYPNGPDQDQADDRFPVTQITQADAEAFAAWAGGRLPTEAEWEYAARGGLEGTLMAWDEAERKALHERANTWQGIFPIANTQDDGYAGTAPVGTYPANGFGLHDMIGNVWEWTSTPYTPSHADRDRDLAGTSGLDFTQPGIAVGTIKGGSYLCARSYCYRFRPAARQAQDLGYGTSHIGFRLVRGGS